MSQGKQMYYHYMRENIRNMHPRLKELAVQAGAYEDGGTLLTGPMDPAKFAELIVKECIDALDEADGSVHHSECLLEHFGVEQ